jgi:hypothetical protein
MAANPAVKARILQAQDQIFLGVSQALAATQQAKAASANQPNQSSAADAPSQTGKTPNP